jgi:hypothetical protein
MIRKLATQSMHLFLALTLALQTSLPFHAHAQISDTQITEASEFDTLLKSSYEIPVGQPRGSYAPDRFLLLEQEVHAKNYVGRSFSFFSTPVERELEEHKSRVDRARKILPLIQSFLGSEPVTAGECADIKAAVIAHVNEARAKDIPPFVWDAKDDKAQLACLESQVKEVIAAWDQQLTSLEEMKPSLEDVPNVTEAPAKEKSRYYNWWNVSVHVRNQQGDETLAILDLQNSADKHSIMNQSAYNCPNSDLCEFQLKSDHTLLNTMHLPVKALTTFGPYVVFVHNDSFDQATGTQYLSFIDLSAYGPALGRAEIPVFRLPLVTDTPITNLEVRNKKLIVGGQKSLGVEAFLAASELQQAAFNITSNLVDPKDIADVIPYIDSIQSYFSQVIKEEIEDSSKAGQSTVQAQVLYKELGEQIKTQILQNKKLNEFANGKKEIQASDEDVASLSKEMQGVLTTYSQGLQKSAVLNNRLSKVSERMSNSRKFRARVQMFFNRVMSPAPNASLKVKRALLMVGAKNNMNSGGFWSFLMDRPYLHSAMFAAGMLAAASPESFTAVAEGGLALGNGIFDYLKFALYGLGEAGLKGTISTFGPVVDFGSAIGKQYFADGAWLKTIIGLGGLVPFILSFFYVPHLIFNLHKIYLDSHKPDWNGFVEHQRGFVREYYQRLADDEAKRRKLKQKEADQIHFTAEEQAEILAFVEKRKSESPAYQAPGYIGRSWNATKSGMGALKRAIFGSKAVQEGDQHKINGVWAAIKSVTFSYPAMELTLGRWARFWNWFAGTRYTSIGFLTLKDLGLKFNFPVFIRPKPISAGTRLLFPDFFTTVVAKRGPSLTIPTALNGGTRGWQTRDLLWIKEAILGKPSEQQVAEELLDQEVTRSEMKALSENFEKEITEVEDAVFKSAFQTAIRRLPEYIADKEELKELFNNKPLHSVVEKRIRDLPARIRTFMRVYFEEIYGRTMSEFMKREISASGAGDTASVSDDRSLKDLKNELLNLRKDNADLKPFKFDKGYALSVAESMGQDDEVFKKVTKQASKGVLSLQNWVINRKHNLIADMDPTQNGSMARFTTVQERMKSPNAFARAVRAEISKLLITFPLDLAFKMILTAGIFEGAFKPIQDHLWGENSILYFSRDLFYMTTAAGFAMSMMADAWMKLQMDARQDDMGDFGNIPKGEDAEKGMLRWFLKQYRGKNNSMWDNYKYNTKLSFWNMPAALANIGLFYYAFSGRVDLSLLFAGYAVTFGTPFGAFSAKIENAFERSSEYAARGIKDEKWMAHPAIQELIGKEKQYYRNKFQLLNDIYGNVQSNWLQTVEVIPTSYGTRGFARALFGGPLLEEAIVEKMLRPLDKLTENIPVVGTAVDKMTSACEYLLTNGNADLNLKKGG